MLTKEEIIRAIMTDYYNDLAFIEEINNLTYGRKVQIKRARKAEKSPNHLQYENSRG